MIDKLEKQARGGAKLHQKRRRLGVLQAKLEQIRADQKAGRVRLCFGSRKLFGAQFALTQNGYASHAEWKADWQVRRAVLRARQQGRDGRQSIVPGKR
ncbi:hypothetical protein [Paraburkholderia sp. PGU19]|uniref:hypothetical protein n=1 Tax=Paraburkholderia sp. PGU19 TaxID=2735434 RepID=UPI0015DB344E|nr:hypothetical protein [Paraburkholderia sp. PGU19]